MSSLLSSRASELRAAIEQFLKERLEAKLKALPSNDPKRGDLLAQFEFSRWIGDAARRVGHLQVVTHPLKGTNPRARGGTSLYVLPSELPRRVEVGSHCLPNQFAADVVATNAAELDVYGFLRITHGGQSLLDLMQADDADMVAALGGTDDAVGVQRWITAFAGIAQARGEPASHTLAKQVYWLVGNDPRGDGAYHLLAPLYASSLTHWVCGTINEDRFGEASTAARKARRDGEFSDVALHEYPNLATQKMGGTKPQNISQLNSERRGINYLLASLPPLWVSPAVTPPLHSDTVFSRFGARAATRHVIKELRKFLESDPSQNKATRDHRDAWVMDLIDELLQLARQLAALPPGWSASAECRLPDEERYWLDPQREETDDAFAAGRSVSDWPEQLCGRFAHWLNRQLDGKLSFGDPEHNRWYGLLREELKAQQRGDRDE